jgi:hypothetical protein
VVRKGKIHLLPTFMTWAPASPHFKGLDARTLGELILIGAP